MIPNEWARRRLYAKQKFVKLFTDLWVPNDQICQAVHHPRDKNIIPYKAEPGTFFEAN